MPKFSIIIPIYNVEQYLDKCIRSVICQKYDDFEVILVDDGSPDKCPEICDRWAKKDNRIKVIHKNNGGTSDARNMGVINSYGEYILFLDGDDWISDNLLYELSLIYNNSSYDLVIWSYIQEFSSKAYEKQLFDNNKVFDKFSCEKLRRQTIGPIGKEMSGPQVVDKFANCTCRAYKSSIIKNNKLQFIDTKIIGTFEDGLFNFEYLRFVNSAYYINKSFYHYRKTNYNSCTNVFRIDIFDSYDVLYSLIGKIILNEELNQDFTTALNNRIVLVIFQLAAQAIIGNFKFKEKRALIKKTVNKQIYQQALSLFNDSYLSIEWKLYFKLVKKGYWNLVLILNQIIKFILNLR